ncbi:MAG: 2-amino-4-hydroxy-6-hydroxymethyldihydropteridine diphosphokinase [Candidatus Kuenenia sp.]|nr:2-amino-4-hydroxy-6-hydroxymethyldihydropteridine diphosphokinase [Candidatus Kuenenia hertensis]
MEMVYIALGSNLGDREENLKNAYDHIIGSEKIQPGKFSRFYETVPVGGPPQPMFLNAVLEMQTSMEPHQLLEELQRIELLMGRIRGEKWGPRIIDLDILLFGDRIVEDDTLKIPHPFMHERMFVLEPLVEIAPHMVHPVLKKKILQMYQELKNLNQQGLQK